VLVVPNLLANAGAVTCSYFEQVQGASNQYWRRDEVFDRLDAALSAAFVAVHGAAGQGGMSLRDAAYLLAVDRVAQACQTRGWV
jgi:glutamate dehydrogenase